MSETKVYERLEQTISLIARHPFYPGKQDAVDDCREELEERYRQGFLTEEEKARLVAILLAPETLEYAGGTHTRVQPRNV